MINADNLSNEIEPVNIYYKVSIFCGFLPIILGATIFVSWKFYRLSWLELLGIMNLYFGVLLFCMGTISLIIFYLKAKARNTKKFKLKSILSFSILLANFPVAILILAEANTIINTSSITIKNESRCSMNSVLLLNQKGSHAFDQIEINEKVEKEIYFKHEGSVKYSFKCSNVEYSGIMIGYVTNGMGISADMTFTNTNEVVINQKLN